MTKVFEDVKGGSINVTLQNGAKVMRRFIVSEIEGNKSAIIFNGINAGGVPRPGDPHPDIPFQTVESIQSEVLGSNEIALSINYSNIAQAVDEEAQVFMSISGSVQSVVTNEFVTPVGKQLMQLEYKYPLNKDPEGTDTIKKIIATATKQQAIVVVTLRRLESQHPLEKVKKFTDKINSRRFLNSAQRTWMCTSITADSNDGNQTFQVSYVFEFREETWDVDLFFTNKETGEIPLDVKDQPLAFNNFQLQEFADFGELNLELFD